MMNRITLDSTHLRPATMAAMIADLMDAPQANLLVIRSLMTQMAISVGDEMTIDFLIDAGITPEKLAEKGV